MKVQQTKKDEFVFEEYEAKQIMAALDYVSHRQKKHRKAHHIDSGFVEHAREWLRQTTQLIAISPF